MKKKFIPLALFSTIFMITSCYVPEEGSQVSSNNNSSSQDSSSEDSEGDSSSSMSSEVSDEFNIQNLRFLYYGDPNEPLVITDTDRANEIVYEYDNEYIEIDDNKVTVIKAFVAPSGYEYKHVKEITVKATLGKISKYFTVSIKQAMNRENKMTTYKNQQSSRGVTKNNYTLVMGDSFFDCIYGNGWPLIYSDIGGQIFNSGIAASTFEEWFHYAPKLIYDIAPKYIAMHLGTNDFWDLNSTVDENYSKFVEFNERIHRHCPNTKIVYFSIENRSYNMTGKSSQQTIQTLNDYNSRVQNYCASHSYITYVNSFSHFTNPDGTCNTSLFLDGTHPIPSEHAFYITKMLECGIDNITYLAGTTPSSFTRTSAQAVGDDPTPIRKNGTSLNRQFVVTGNISYSYSGGSNAHFEFGIGSHFDYRILLWNNNNGANTLYAAAVYNSNHGVVSNSDGISGTSNSFSFKLLASNKSTYLFVNDKLKAILYCYVTNGEITISSEVMNINASNVTINTLGDGSNVYENLLATLSTYENDSSTVAEGRVIN